MLRNKSIKAVSWELIGRLSSQLIGFIVSIILARLLTPNEFGHIGIALTAIGILNGLLDLGFSQALIRNKKNDSLIYSSVFLLNSGLGLIIFILLQLFAHSMATFFALPSLENIIKWLSFGVFAKALNVVQYSILVRELKFKQLNIATFTASLTSGIIGVILAFNGFGIYALVSQSLITSFLGTIFLWKIIDWRPTLNFSWLSLQPLFSFSFYNILDGITYNIFVKTNPLIIGKLFTTYTLGLYTRAESLNDLVIKYTSGTLDNIVFSILSQIQNDIKRFREAFLKIIKLTSFFTFLLSGIIILNAKLVILNLFGSKWQDCIYIFQILSFHIYNYPISSIIVNSFLARNLAKENFWYGNLRKLLYVIAYLIAYFYGFDYFLYSIVILSIIGTLFNNFIASLHHQISFISQIIAIYKFGLIFLLVMGLIFVLPINISYLILGNILKTSIFIILYLIGGLSIDQMVFEEVKWLIKKFLNKIKIGSK